MMLSGGGFNKFFICYFKLLLLYQYYFKGFESFFFYHYRGYLKVNNLLCVYVNIVYFVCIHSNARVPKLI